MNDAQRLRESIARCEDKKMTVDQLGREVWHFAREIEETDQASIRQTFFRMANRLRALAERSLHDDVVSDLRDTLDELQSHLIDLPTEST